MPTSLYEFNTPENFDTAWIFVRANSDLNGADNPKVPRYLANRQSEKGTWGLVLNGEVITQNEAFDLYEPTFGIGGGGNYSVGEKKYNAPVYNDRQDTSTTGPVTVEGEFFGGPNGTGFTTPSGNNETAWYVFDQTGPSPWTLIVWEGVIFYFGQYTQYNLFDNPISQPFGSTEFDTTDGANHSTLGDTANVNVLIGPDQVVSQFGDAIFTRGQKVFSKSTSSTGAFEETFGLQSYIDAGVPQGDVSVYNIARKEPDTTETRIILNTINQNTYYEFYEVLWTEASEVDNYTASAVIVLPTHILQRSLTKLSTTMKFNGLDLGESYIRVAADMASGLGEVKDLYDNYGIEAQAIPIVLSIGGNAIVLGINQIEDIAINNARDKHVLRYDEESRLWKNIFASDVAFSGSYFDLVDAPGTPSIENMDDTEISNTLADGNVLKWNDSLQKWVNAPETAEVNDLSSAVTWVDIPDLYITESSVTQHQDALSITQSQITDLQHYTDVSVDTHLNQSSASTGQVLTWNGSDYSWTNTFDGAFSSLTGTPTTLAGYGITDGNTAGSGTGTGGSGYPWGAGGTNDYEINGGPPIYIINGGSPTTTDINELDGGTI